MRVVMQSAEASREEHAVLERELGAGYKERVQSVDDAIKAGDMVKLQALFDKQPPMRGDLPSGRGLGGTWLQHAAQYGGGDAVRFLLQRGAPLEETDSFGDTPLLTAARQGIFAALTALLAAGASVRVCNKTGSTALHLAVMVNSVPCCTALLDAGASLNVTTRSDGWTPAMWAVRGDKAEVMKVLLSHPRARTEMDMKVLSNPPFSVSLVDMVTRAGSGITANAYVMRQLVIEEAVRRETLQRGSADPNNALALHSPRPSPPRTMFGFPGSMGYIPDTDPATPPPAKPNALPRRGRVVRYRDGATVVNVQELAPSEFVAQRKSVVLAPLHALLLAQHRRLGADSPAQLLPADAGKLIASMLTRPPRRACGRGCKKDRCICADSGTPCLSDCPSACRGRNPLSSLRLTTAAGKDVKKRLSDCAADHYSTVASLTAEQLSARFPFACEERWGGPMWGGEEHATANGARGVALRQLLDDNDEACARCGGDGEQFFSFCLNRPVNSDRVAHCLSCGRCFYFHSDVDARACPYCASAPRGADAEEQPGCMGQEAEEFERGLAMEGYWGS